MDIQTKLDLLILTYQEEMLQTLGELIKINTVTEENKNYLQNKPFGNNIEKALHYSLSLAKKWGFATENLHGYVGIIDYNNLNDAQESVGILTHTDIVPAGDNWSVPPFSGTIMDNKIFGRGALDDKGPLVSIMFAMRAIAELAPPLSKKIRHIIGTDEETGFRCLEHYLEHYPQPDLGFSPDGDFPVIYGEKGIAHLQLSKTLQPTTVGDIILLSLHGGTRVNVVAGSAQAVLAVTMQGRKIMENAYAASPFKDSLLLEDDGLTITVTAKGVPTHASLPEDGVNAINLLLAFITTLNLENQAIYTFCQNLYYLLGQDYLGKNLGIACSDQDSGALTLIMGIINLNQEQGTVQLDMRYPVTGNAEHLLALLTQKCTEYQITVTELQNKKPLFIPQESPLIKTLLNVYQEVTGDDSPPIAIGGGTYCRALKNFVAFGPLFPHTKSTAHQNDEYLNLDDFMTMTKIYARAIYNLAK